MGTTKIITTLVLVFKRFWQKSLYEKLKPKISLVAPDGPDELNVLPLQLKNAFLFLGIGSWFSNGVRSCNTDDIKVCGQNASNEQLEPLGLILR